LSSTFLLLKVFLGSLYLDLSYIFGDIQVLVAQQRCKHCWPLHRK